MPFEPTYIAVAVLIPILSTAVVKEAAAVEASVPKALLLFKKFRAFLEDSSCEIQAVEAYR